MLAITGASGGTVSLDKDIWYILFVSGSEAQRYVPSKVNPHPPERRPEMVSTRSPDLLNFRIVPVVLMHQIWVPSQVTPLMVLSSKLKYPRLLP